MMIIEDMVVENWRGYRGVHKFHFESGINLVVGPNEAGKTTLFEVLWRTFFDRFSTNSADMQEIRPAGTYLSPRSSVVFTHGGKRYKIEKQFLDNPDSKFYEEVGGKLLPRSERDKADKEIVDVLEGVRTGKGSTKPEHRGLAEALWYLQKDRSLPSEKWNEGLQRGFSGIIDFAVQTPEEKRIINSIREDYSKNLTETKGEPKKNTELSVISDRLDPKRGELKELQTRMNQADSLRESIMNLASEEEVKTGVLNERKLQKKKLDEEVKESYIFEGSISVKESEHEGAKNKAKELRKMKEAINDRFKTVEETDKDLDGWGQELENLDFQSRQSQREETEYEKKWKDELQPRLRQVESGIQEIESLERVDSLKKEKTELEAFIKKYEDKEKQREEEQKKFDELYSPSQKELMHFRELEDELIKVQSSLSANSIKIGFELKKGFKVSPNRKIEIEGAEYIVSEPTVFNINKVGKVSVNGGVDSLNELINRKNSLDSSISGMLGRYGAEDETELVALRQRKLTLEESAKRSNRELTGLKRERPTAKSDLEDLKGRIAEEQKKMQKASFQSYGGKSDTKEIRNRKIDLGKEREQLMEDIKNFQSEEKKASENFKKQNRQVTDLRTKIAEAKERNRTLKEENAKIINQFGNMDGLEVAIKRANENETRTRDGLAHHMEQLEEKVNRPRKVYKDTERAIEEIDSRLSEIKKEEENLTGRIEQIGLDGLYTKTADLEIEIGGLESRKNVLEKRAEARRLLKEILEVFEAERAGAIGSPIRKYVDPWIRQLTGSRYESIDIDESLKPIYAVMNGGNVKLSIVSLSYGTTEQVIVLVRLAMAVILSKNERNLVVLDDRLVNADPVRFQRMLSIIEEVALKCQIVIATCEDSGYLGLDANIIRIPDLTLSGPQDRL